MHASPFEVIRVIIKPEGAKGVRDSLFFRAYSTWRGRIFPPTRLLFSRHSRSAGCLYVLDSGQTATIIIRLRRPTKVAFGIGTGSNARPILLRSDLTRIKIAKLARPFQPFREFIFIPLYLLHLSTELKKRTFKIMLNLRKIEFTVKRRKSKMFRLSLKRQ